MGFDLGRATGIRTGSRGLTVGNNTIVNQKDANTIGRTAAMAATPLGLGGAIGAQLLAPGLVNKAFGQKASKQADLPAIDESGKPLYPTLRSTLDTSGALKKEYSSAGTWLPMAQKQLQAGTATALNQAQVSGGQALQQGMGALASRGGLTGGASERMALKSGISTGEQMMGAQDRASQQGLSLATQAGQTDLQQLMAGTTQANQQAMDKYATTRQDWAANVQAQQMAREAEAKRRQAEAAREGGIGGAILGVGGSILGGMAGAAGGPAGIAAGSKAGGQLGTALGNYAGQENYKYR